jgi:alpha-1,6-mannosyltransferase
MKNKFNLLFLSSVVLIEFFLLLFLILNIDGNIPLYMFIYFQFFLLFLLAFYLVKKDLVNLHLPHGVNSILMKMLNINKEVSLPVFIIAAGILFRVTLIPAELTTSPDALRYIWEGKVIVNGYNPYMYEPVHEELAHLRTPDLPSKIHYKEKKAVYPPGAQYIFALAYLISSEDLWGLKLLYLLFEALTMIFLLKLLHLKNKNMNYVLLYAWLPLPVMEYFVNAHLDAIGLSFFIMFLYFLEKQKHFTSSVCYALAFLSRFYPIFIFPLFLKRLGLKGTLHYGIVLVLFTIAFYLPFITQEVNIFSFLMLYLERWEFNASVYYFLKLFTTNETARILCAVMFFITIGLISYYFKEFSKAALGILIAMIIFTSTVYPWYLGWLAVLNPLHVFYSALSLFFTVNLSNLTPLSPVWTEYTIVLLIEYITFFVLLIFKDSKIQRFKDSKIQRFKD